MEIKLEPTSLNLSPQRKRSVPLLQTEYLIKQRPRLHAKLSWLTGSLVLGLSMIILFSFVWTFGIRLAFVSGESMMPTLKQGQLLILQPYRLWLGKTLKVGDIVVFDAPKGLPKKHYVKRLIAEPGDTVSIGQEGLYLNGKKQPTAFAGRPDTFPDLVLFQGQVIALEGYALADLPDYLKPLLAMLQPLPQDILNKSFTSPLEKVGSLKLAKDWYFILGDNLNYNASEDSRYFGPISRKNLLARVQPLNLNVQKYLGHFK